VYTVPQGEGSSLEHVARQGLDDGRHDTARALGQVSQRDAEHGVRGQGRGAGHVRRGGGSKGKGEKQVPPGAAVLAAPHLVRPLGLVLKRLYRELHHAEQVIPGSNVVVKDVQAQDLPLHHVQLEGLLPTRVSRRLLHRRRKAELPVIVACNNDIRVRRLGEYVRHREPLGAVDGQDETAAPFVQNFAGLLLPR